MIGLGCDYTIVVDHATVLTVAIENVIKRSVLDPFGACICVQWVESKILPTKNIRRAHTGQCLCPI